jgi:microcystin-dependent protein
VSSVFSTNLHLEEPGLGDYANTWNTFLNADLSVIDQAMGSSTSIAFTNSNVTLTVAQSAFYMIVCTGTLTGNVQLILPATIGGGRQIFNQCAGAYTLTVLNGAGDTGGGVLVGQGYSTPIVLTAGRAYYDGYSAIPPGTPLPFAGVNPPPGFLLAYGQTLLIATYPALASALGTTWGTAAGGSFVMPDCRGRILAGADNMGGTAASRLTGYVVGSVGGEQTHVLTTAELAAHAHAITDPGHLHGTTDPGHIHTYQSGGVAGSNYPQIANGPSSVPSTNSAVTNLSINTATTGLSVNSAGSGTAHNNVQPTMAVNWMIRY